MKKSILLTFLLFPILASCNNRDLGFPNPFPNDTYEPIGFKILSEGKINRPLTTQETDLINATMELAKKSNIYKNIKEEEIEIQERDYTRAFCGEFAQGYSVSNKMIEGNEKIYRQDFDGSLITKQRRVDKRTTKETYNYSYGDNVINVDRMIYNYIAKKADGSYKYKEDQEGDKYIYQTYLNDVTLGTSGAGFLNDADPFLISQSDFIFNPASATSLPGVNKDNKVVLIRETHDPYDGEYVGDEPGIYLFKDGRSYCARNNTFTISILDHIKPQNDEEEWYFVEQARRYSETVITSEVIQPNVPITYLSKPIVIHYLEEKIKFHTTLTHTDQTKVMDLVEIPDPELQL